MLVNLFFSKVCLARASLRKVRVFSYTAGPAAYDGEVSWSPTGVTLTEITGSNGGAVDAF